MRPLFPYPGGKSKLLKNILPFIPRESVQTYVEPFAGGLAVMLAHDDPFPKEVANDKDAGLVGFYRTAAAHPEALIADLEWCIASRTEFDNAVLFPARGTELGRATLWYWLQRHSFGGQRQHYGRGKDSYRGVDVEANGAEIRKFSRRAKDVIFQNRDACAVIREFDASDTFFFVDPPYVACGDTAYSPFTEADMERLRDVLAACKGMWLLTCDDSPVTRKVFSGFRAQENKIRYSLAKDKSGKVSGELMVFSDNLAQRFAGENLVVVNTSEFSWRGDDFLFVA